jgi:hypothetical protein
MNAIGKQREYTQYCQCGKPECVGCDMCGWCEKKHPCECDLKTTTSSTRAVNLDLITNLVVELSRDHTKKDTLALVEHLRNLATDFENRLKGSPLPSRYESTGSVTSGQLMILKITAKRVGVDLNVRSIQLFNLNASELSQRNANTLILDLYDKERG